MPTSPERMAAATWLRRLPFVILAGASVWAALRAPAGRKPFSFDCDLSLGAINDGLANPRHMWASGVLLVAAVIATGLRRIPLAIGMTVLVGSAWEAAQTTVVGHYARLRDLLPDLVGALAAAVIVRLLGWAWLTWSRSRSSSH